jgi:AcrR family transcriptional regulator
MPAADDPRQRLIDAAGPLFAELGKDGAPVREICNRAGVNVAAINYYFKDKDAFYSECVRVAGLGCASRATVPEWAPGTDWRVKLRDFIAMMLRRVAVDYEPAWQARLILREIFQPTEACARFVDEFVRPTFLMLRNIMAEALPHLDEQRRFLAGFSIIAQCLHYRFTRAVIPQLIGQEAFNALNVELLTDHVTAFSVAALERLAQEPIS